MQYTIKDMANYIRDKLPKEIPENFPIKEDFISTLAYKDHIPQAIRAFRDLLLVICNGLSNENVSSSNGPSNSKKNLSHQSLALAFPLINDIKSVLFNIGYMGNIQEDDKHLLIEDVECLYSSINAEGRQLRAKISRPRFQKVISFLKECGFKFMQDSEIQNPVYNQGESLKIYYPNEPLVFLGLKTMAMAQKEYFFKGRHNIFLRCDYRVLMKNEPSVNEIFKAFIDSLDPTAKDICIKLHQKSIDFGLSCTYNAFYMSNRLIYTYKNKEIWTLSKAFESGYRVLIKAKNMDAYPQVILNFPMWFQDKIKRGYGCDKKLFSEPCQKGCHGYSFPLDGSLENLGPCLDVILSQEMKYL